jgi:hypothetical protein
MAPRGLSCDAVEVAVMRVAGIRELRENVAAILGGAEPVLVTRHGKLSGLYVPLDDSNRIPDDLRRKLAATLGRHLSARLQSKGLTEGDVLEDFDAHRRRRRGR